MLVMHKLLLVLNLLVLVVLNHRRVQAADSRVWVLLQELRRRPVKGVLSWTAGPRARLNFLGGGV